MSIRSVGSLASQSSGPILSVVHRKILRFPISTFAQLYWSVTFFRRMLRPWIWYGLKALLESFRSPPVLLFGCKQCFLFSLIFWASWGENTPLPKKTREKNLFPYTKIPWNLPPAKVFVMIKSWETLEVPNFLGIGRLVTRQVPMESFQGELSIGAGLVKNRPIWGKL